MGHTILKEKQNPNWLSFFATKTPRNWYSIRSFNEYISYVTFVDGHYYVEWFDDMEVYVSDNF